MILYGAIYALGVFFAAVAQVMLKMEAMKPHDSLAREYLNPMVIGAYTIFVGTTLLTILAYTVIPISLGCVLESTSYLYVTAFGIYIFHEKVNTKKLVAIGLIILGVIVFSMGLPT